MLKETLAGDIFLVLEAVFALFRKDKSPVGVFLKVNFLFLTVFIVFYKIVTTVILNEEDSGHI